MLKDVTICCKTIRFISEALPEALHCCKTLLYVERLYSLLKTDVGQYEDVTLRCETLHYVVTQKKNALIRTLYGKSCFNVYV